MNSPRKYLLEGGFVLNLSFPRSQMEVCQWRLVGKIKQSDHLPRQFFGLLFFMVNTILLTLFQTYFIIISGPRKPIFYVQSTPDASPSSSQEERSLFSQDTSILETDSDKGKSSVSLANKMVNNSRMLRFRFKTKEELDDAQQNYSPTSSPIPLPSLPRYEISSDEDLENYMLELESSINNSVGDY